MNSEVESHDLSQATSPGDMKLRDAAEQAGVRPETLRRWADSGVIPQVDRSVKLKGFSEPRVLSRATQSEADP